MQDRNSNWVQKVNINILLRLAVCEYLATNFERMFKRVLFRHNEIVRCIFILCEYMFTNIERLNIYAVEKVTENVNTI